MDNTTQRMMMGSGGLKGQQLWDTPGTHTFQVPEGVTSISAVAIGGGGSGDHYTGGDGGSLRWIANIAVTPLETLTIIIPAIKTSGQSQTVSYLRRGATELLSSTTFIGAGMGGGNGKSGYNGGQYTNPSGWTVPMAGGGGGAAGYSGNAGGGATGDGGVVYADDSNGCASTAGQSGGSVGAKGQGATGASWGGDGSGGGYGQGGGAGGAINSVGTITQFDGANGGIGAVRIIWGVGRAYPSTRTADE